MGLKSQEPPDWALARLAARQHGVVAVWQLAELGLSANEIKVRKDRGQLHPVHRGVFAVGHANLTLKGRWLAATFAYGPTAVLSHVSALALWELRPRRPGPIHVSVPSAGRRSRPAITVHSVGPLHPLDHVTLNAIPVTSVERTLLDHADRADAQELRLAVEAADGRQLLDVRALDALTARSPGRRGLPALKAAITALTGPPPATRSELERQFLALIRAHGLPEPQTNVLVEGHLVDVCWPQARVIVELDGYRFHRGRASFESDRARDAQLIARGWRVIRITHRRLTDDPEGVIRDLLALLVRAA